jgi:integrase-like protein
MPEVLLDAAGRPRSPATLPGFHAGRSPRNKGQRYPADPPTVAEIVSVMRHAGNGLHAARLRALIVVLWRAGLRIHEALALGEADLDARRGSLLVRRGKGGRRREVGMDDWAWEQLQPWLNARVELPVGPLLCIATGPTRGRAWSAGAARAELRHAARSGRRASPLRTTPASPRARRRDGPRGRPADRHPTPTRAHEPRDHLDLPAGHRQHRDHRHRPRTPCPDGARRCIPSPKAHRTARTVGRRPKRQPGLGANQRRSRDDERSPRRSQLTSPSTTSAWSSPPIAASRCTPTPRTQAPSPSRRSGSSEAGQ